MLTYRCNLRCPYCFANEFVGRTDLDISEEDFEEALAFATDRPKSQIGLIGGEPTVHPKLETFLRRLSVHPNVADVMLYTNGLRLEPVLQLCQDPTIQPMLRILVNCNSPAVMGERNFEALKRSLDLAFGKYHVGQNVKLGLNLYSNDFDYGFIKELLLRYDLRQLRISLTVPDFSACGRVDAVENFKSRKEYLLGFYREMDEIGVLPYYDCNQPPRCVFTDEEWLWLLKYRARYRDLPTNITEPVSRCAPVVDILPDLRAVWCFGMSDFAKVSIRDFDSLEDLRGYFRNRVDAEAFRVSSGAECRNCYDRQTGRCTGGCLGYKEGGLRKLDALLETL